MAEDFHVKTTSDKADAYDYVYSVIQSMFSSESDMIANMANLCAVLKSQFGWHWVGFYIVKGQELVLGPFQGPVACTRIGYNKGVCGTSWAQKRTLVVPNVHEFGGHIACSSLSNSEIVVPVLSRNDVLAILDIDSVDFDSFDLTDAMHLEKIVAMISGVKQE